MIGPNSTAQTDVYLRVYWGRRPLSTEPRWRTCRPEANQKSEQRLAQLCYGLINVCVCGGGVRARVDL